MFEEEIKRQRETLYKIYNEEVKPLVAEIEARFEEFPEPLLAEMFFFNDYMAQGYREPVTEEQFEESIKSAFAHLEKVKLYLYIYLNAALVQAIELFEEQTRNVDMKDINDGEFLKEYSEMKKEAENKLKHAQEREEWLSVEVASALYKESYQDYRKLEYYLNIKCCEINRATSMHRLSIKKQLFVWVLPIVVSAFVSFYFSGKIISFIFLLFNS